VVLTASGSLRTNPAPTNPMRQMNSPMPTAIDALSCAGTALNTAWRTPVATSASTTSPLITTSPIACGQLISGAIVTATSVLMPRPVAIAKG
jgi:hypothetical protein